MKHIKKYEYFHDSVLPNDVDEKEIYLNQASELLGKELDDKNAIPEIRDQIELLLQQGDNEKADQLTDIKFELEPLLKEGKERLEKGVTLENGRVQYNGQTIGYDVSFGQILNTEHRNGMDKWTYYLVYEPELFITGEEMDDGTIEEIDFWSSYGNADMVAKAIAANGYQDGCEIISHDNYHRNDW